MRSKSQQPKKKANRSSSASLWIQPRKHTTHTRSSRSFLSWADYLQRRRWVLMGLGSAGLSLSTATYMKYTRSFSCSARCIAKTGVHLPPALRSAVGKPDKNNAVCTNNGYATSARRALRDKGSIPVTIPFLLFASSTLHHRDACVLTREVDGRKWGGESHLPTPTPGSMLTYALLCFYLTFSL